jgi:hypothetical protein
MVPVMIATVRGLAALPSGLFRKDSCATDTNAGSKGIFVA